MQRCCPPNSFARVPSDDALPLTPPIDRLLAASVQGETPRNFHVDEAAGVVRVANQDTDSITIFAIAPADGKLSFKAAVQMPKDYGPTYAGLPWTGPQA